MVLGGGRIEQIMELVSIQSSLQGMLSGGIWKTPIRQKILEKLNGRWHARDGAAESP